MGQTIAAVFDRFFSKIPAKILMVGLDAAGKTTILYKLKLGGTISTIPTIGYNLENILYRNMLFILFDVRGQRRVWKYFYPNKDALIFVVDSNDRERITEVTDELQSMLLEDDLRDCLLLIYANKQDLSNSMSITELTDILKLNTLKNRKWYIQPTCATQGIGLYEGLDWLYDELTTK